MLDYIKPIGMRKDEQGVSMPAGMYFYTIQTEKFKDTKKMILLK